MSHVKGVTHAIARLSELAEAPNPLTQKLEPNMAELPIRSWDVVPALLYISGRYPGVSASFISCEVSLLRDSTPVRTC